MQLLQSLDAHNASLRRDDKSRRLGKFGGDEVWQCIPKLLQLGVRARTRAGDRVPLASFLVWRATARADVMPLRDLIFVVCGAETLQAARPVALFQVRCSYAFMTSTAVQ
jgi:hypothetical protein